MAYHFKLSELERDLRDAANRQGICGVNIWGYMAKELHLAAIRLHQINLSECNGLERWNPQLKMRTLQWNDSDQSRADRLREKAEKRVRAAMAVIYGSEWEKFFILEFNGDPRGAPIKIRPVNMKPGPGIPCDPFIITIR